MMMASGSASGGHLDRYAGSGITERLPKSAVPGEAIARNLFRDVEFGGSGCGAWSYGRADPGGGARHRRLRSAGSCCSSSVYSVISPEEGGPPSCEEPGEKGNRGPTPWAACERSEVAW